MSCNEKKTQLKKIYFQVELRLDFLSKIFD